MKWFQQREWMHGPSLSQYLHKEAILAVKEAQPRVKMTLAHSKAKGQLKTLVRNIILSSDPLG